MACGTIGGVRIEGIAAAVPKARVRNADFELFEPAKRAHLDLPGIVPGNFVAGFTGAHGIANGLSAVLDAAAELRRRGRNDIKLVLIGDGKEKPRLVARAQAEGLDNCLFLAPVKKTEIARITASFDCGMQILANVPAFYYGTSPNKFFDYISSGIPVVNNYPGWLADLISQHQCGIAVKPDDPVAFADALCRLADDAATRRKMGAAARALAEQEFDRDRLAAKFVSFLEAFAADAKSDDPLSSANNVPA